MNLNEDYIISCKSILESIVNEGDKNTRKLKSYDFLDKFEKVIRHKHDDAKHNKHRHRHYDVIIFTVVPVEFQTLDKILHPSKDKPLNLHGLLYYEFTLKRSNDLELTGLITLVGVAGDVNCSIAVSRALTYFNCDLAILCGIAAGIKGEADMYSTVVAESITNYEFQRIEEKKTTFRPKNYKIKPYYANILPNICANQQTEWREELLSYYKDFIPDKADFPVNKLDKAQFKIGPIASGAKLLADGKTLRMIRDEIPVEKGIIAAEMEGSGFAPACDDHDKHWLVFRGISDLGSKDKSSGKNKKYQYMAVASAALAMIRFLKFYYRTPAEMSDITF